MEKKALTTVRTNTVQEHARQSQRSQWSSARNLAGRDVVETYLAIPSHPPLEHCALFDICPMPLHLELTASQKHCCELHIWGMAEPLQHKHIY